MMNLQIPHIWIKPFRGPNDLVTYGEVTSVGGVAGHQLSLIPVPGVFHMQNGERWLRSPYSGEQVTSAGEQQLVKLQVMSLLTDVKPFSTSTKAKNW